MRILILTQHFPPEVGAASLRLAAIVREIKRFGHDVEVVTALPNYPLGKIFQDYRGRFYVREKWEGVPVHRLWIYASMGAGFKRLLNYISFMVTSLVGLFRSSCPDLVFVNSPPLFLSIPAYLAARRWRVPFIFHVADLWPDSVRELGMIQNEVVLRIAEWLERWTYRKAMFVNAATEGIREVLVTKKGVPEEKVLFFPNGVDTRLFRPLPRDEQLARKLGLENQRILLYAGNLGYAQGLETALEAMDRLKRVRPELTLLLVGSGSEQDKLRRLVSDRKLHNVRFLGTRPPEEVARLFSLADAGLVILRNIPLFEGARPSKVFPIMATGKPVVYCGPGEGGRLVHEAEAGVVVPAEDPDALAQAVLMLLEQPDLAAEMGRKGRRYVETYLSWSRIVEEWLREMRDKSPGKQVGA